MVHYQVYCKKSQCQLLRMTFVNQCIAVRVILNTFHIYSFVLDGRRADMIHVKVRTVECSVKEFVWILNYVNFIWNRWQWWSHGDPKKRQKIPADWSHFMGHWLRWAQSTRCLYKNFRVSWLDKSNSSILTPFFYKQTPPLPPSIKIVILSNIYIKNKNFVIVFISILTITNYFHRQFSLQLLIKEIFEKLRVSQTYSCRETWAKKSFLTVLILF